VTIVLLLRCSGSTLTVSVHLLELDSTLLATLGVVEGPWWLLLDSSSRGSGSFGCHGLDERVERVSEDDSVIAI
jgi:hypothetical protein